MHIVMILMYFY